MSTLTKPLHITTLDPRLKIGDGAENNDVCINIGNILEDHKRFLPEIRAIYPDDPWVINVWPSLGIEWAGTRYKEVALGRNCNVDATLGVNIWYYREDLDKSKNNQMIRLMCDIIGKVMLSHRLLNGFSTRPLDVVESILEPRERLNKIFDAGRVTLNVPVRICQFPDNSRGAVIK